MRSQRHLRRHRSLQSRHLHHQTMCLSLPADASSIALSSGYVADSDPSEEDPEKDHVEYPANGGDNDDEEEESFEGDEEDEASEEEEDEEEEHLAPTDFTTLPAIDPVPSAKDIEAFETDESAPTPPPPRSPRIKVPFAQTHLRRARKTVRPQPPMTVYAEALINEYASAPTPLSPPPSPLSSLSSPFLQVPSPPLHVLSPPLPLPSPPTSPTYDQAPLGYRAAMIRSRAASSPLLLPSTAHKDDIPKACLPLQKRACFTAPTSSICASESKAMTAIGEVNEKVIDLATTQRQDAHELQVHCEDAQDDRALLRAQVSLLTRERRYFRLMAYSYEREAAEARRA
ncbi:hypothetical protein Tco_0497139 [Tanacetum coccineum]